MRALTIAALLLALLVSGCFDDGGNSSCTSNCFSLNGIDNESPAAVEAKIKAMCESMGRKGKPEIKQQTKTSVAGYCPE